MKKRLHTVNPIDQGHLAEVTKKMRRRGPPTIRVVDCGDHYFALEGSHRLEAARQLGLRVRLEVVPRQRLVNVRGEDIAVNWGDPPPIEATAEACVARLRGNGNGIYRILEDGKVERVREAKYSPAPGPFQGTADGRIVFRRPSDAEQADYVRQVRQDICDQQEREEKHRSFKAVAQVLHTMTKVLSQGGRTLKRDQRPYVGVPKPLARGKRGPAKRPIVDADGVTRGKTEFDVWQESLAESFRRLAKLPLISKLGTEGRQRVGERPKEHSKHAIRYVGPFQASSAPNGSKRAWIPWALSRSGWRAEGLSCRQTRLKNT